MDQLRAIFYHPERLRAHHITEQVTEAAAKEFAHLADLLRSYSAEPQAAAHFLTRLLPEDLFTRLVKSTRRQPAAFEGQLRVLFGAMTDGGWFGPEEIRRFDGRIFDDAEVLPLDADGLDILDRVSTLDWSSIEPSVFCTRFERSLDPSKQ
jgi:hypothetical protein